MTPTLSQSNYLAALLTLTAGDVSQTPLGSDKELGEDETDNAREGGRQRDFFVKVRTSLSPRSLPPTLS